jgi:hypothetical protein
VTLSPTCKSRRCLAAPTGDTTIGAPSEGPLPQPQPGLEHRGDSLPRSQGAPIGPGGVPGPGLPLPPPVPVMPPERRHAGHRLGRLNDSLTTAHEPGSKAAAAQQADSPRQLRQSKRSGVGLRRKRPGAGEWQRPRSFSGKPSWTSLVSAWVRSAGAALDRLAARCPLIYSVYSSSLSTGRSPLLRAG